MKFSIYHSVSTLYLLYTNINADAASLSTEMDLNHLRNGSKINCTGDCLDTFPGFLLNIESQKYYLANTLPIVGPCGKFMFLYQDGDNTQNAICKCQNSTNCAGRPLLYREEEKRCYYGFEQGPCKNGEWLVSDKDNKSECELNPCPLGPSTNDNYFDFALDFYFTDAKGKCYKTNTSDFCQDKKQRVFFVGTQNEPICSEENQLVILVVQ